MKSKQQSEPSVPGKIEYIGQHHFHTNDPVFRVPPGTLEIREKLWVEIHGYGQGRAHVPVAEAGAWAEVYEELKKRWEEKEGRPCLAFTSLFYLVSQEEGKVSCGTIDFQPSHGLYCLVG